MIVLRAEAVPLDLQEYFMPLEPGAPTSVWAINPTPYPGAHFAVMSETLASTCIKAGASEYGCCPKCKAPWVRMVETSGGRDWHQDKMVAKGIPGELAGEGSYKRGQSKTPLNNTKQRSFMGWEPSCGCNQEQVPCTVLDPFSGSGTTGQESLKVHRDYLGIDVQSKYLPLAKARILGTPVVPEAPLDGDAYPVLDMFKEW